MILVLGATGFLGKHVCRKLDERGLRYTATSKSLGVDLRSSKETNDLFDEIKPEYVLNCAAYVGGIQFGSKYPADIFQNNLKMTLNILESSKNVGVKRIVNPISNCAYPAKATLFKEEEFWDGPLHESVLVYGFVRKAFWVGSWAYTQQYSMDIVNLILSNMYGPHDHFDEERSHALGALIKKIVYAKKNDHSIVDVWGSGKPVREWLHVDDGAESLIRSIYIEPHEKVINIGVGKGITIREMAELIKKYACYTGELKFDESKPDGAPYKTVDGSNGKRIFGWQPQIEFTEGVADTVKWYIEKTKKQ